LISIGKAFELTSSLNVMLSMISWRLLWSH